MNTVYDEFAKQILSRKDILSTIMEACIPEYKGLPRETIMACIEEGDMDIPLIHGMNVEDVRMNDAEIILDLLFTSRLPDSTGQIGLHINLEIQNDDNPGYPLEKRGIYYASRMISGQKGTIFTGSAYGKLEKVYSIWICPKAERVKRNSICMYSFNEVTVMGKYHAPKENYDLITMIMLYLGNHYDYEENEKSVLAMLRLLFAENELEPQERRNLLEEQYAILLSEKEASDMGGFSDAIASEWYEKGHDKGFTEGHDEGFVEGSLKTRTADVRALMAAGMSFDEIVRILKLDEETVEKLRNILK